MIIPSLLDRYVPKHIADNLVLLTAPIGLVPLTAWIAHVLWRKPATRAVALIVLAVAYFAAITWCLELGEDHYTRPDSNRRLIQMIHDRFDGAPYALCTFGYHDQTLSFYFDRDVLRIPFPHDDHPIARLAAPGEHWIIIADADKWTTLTTHCPDFTAHFQKSFDYPHARQHLSIYVERQPN